MHTFQTTQTDLRHHNGRLCSIVRSLTSDEADAEVGPMFKIRFEDGTEIDAFEDELIVPVEDLTPDGIQLVIPGAERIQPAAVKQGELF